MVIDSDPDRCVKCGHYRFMHAKPGGISTGCKVLREDGQPGFCECNPFVGPGKPNPPRQSWWSRFFGG